MVILGLKFSFQIENFNAEPCFFCSQRGAQIETKTTFDWKCHYVSKPRCFNLEIYFFDLCHPRTNHNSWFLAPQTKLQKNGVSCRKMLQKHALSVLQNNALSCTKIHFLTEKCGVWEKLNRGVSKPGCFPLFLGKVQIVSLTPSGLFLVGALRLRKRKRTNRENPRTIPAQIGKIPGKVPKGQKRKDKSRSGNPPVWNTPV